MTCDVQEFMTEAAPFMGLTSGQLLVAIVQLLCQIKGGDCTPQTLMVDGVQFTGLTEGQLLVAQVQLLCEWLESFS